MAKFLLFACLCFMNACTVSYTSSIVSDSLADSGLNDQHSYKRMADWRIAPSVNIGLKLADPETSLLPRTTKQLNKTMIAEFSERFSTYHLVSPSYLARELNQAFHAGCELLVIADLVMAENKLNTRQEVSLGQRHFPEREWGRDRLQLKLAIYETQSHQLLDLVVVESKARFFKKDNSLALHLLEDSVENVMRDLTYPRQRS